MGPTLLPSPANKYPSPPTPFFPFPHFPQMLSPTQFQSRVEPGPPADPSELRRLRRMISNRESARRSRMRKQRHLDDLRRCAVRLRSENRELAARLGAVLHHSSLFRAHNDALRRESSALRNRLSEIRRIVFLRQLQRLSLPAVNCGGFGCCSGNEQTLASLIT